MKKLSLLERFNKAHLWQRIVLELIFVLGIAAYIYNGFFPRVEHFSGFLGRIQNEVSAHYNGSPVAIDLRSSDHTLSISILNPQGVEVGDLHNKEFEQFGSWIAEYLNNSGIWKSLSAKDIDKLEVGFKRTIPLFSMQKTQTLKLTFETVTRIPAASLSGNSSDLTSRGEPVRPFEFNFSQKLESE